MNETVNSLFQISIYVAVGIFIYKDSYVNTLLQGFLKTVVTQWLYLSNVCYYNEQMFMDVHAPIIYKKEAERHATEYI